MRFTKALLLTLSMLAVGLFLLPMANADQWNKKTKVTFSQPVEIPGQILPAGTYIIKLLDSDSNRSIVRISNEDETEVIATILAIPNQRLKPTEDTLLRFKERAAGTPQAIHAWFYPGDLFGQEFVYPKVRATELAKITKEPVLETPTEIAKAPVETLKTAPVEAVEPSGEVVEQAKVVEPPPVEQAKAAPPAVEQSKAAPPALPQTASPLPLLGFLGLLTLIVGLVVAVTRKGAA